MHATPALQHVRALGGPQGVVPAGHPHTLLLGSTHAMPLLQHEAPHGVVPAAQQQLLPALLQVFPR